MCKYYSLSSSKYHNIADFYSADNHAPELGLDVSVAWLGSNLTQVVHSRTSSGSPSLFRNWTPNTLTLMGKEAFGITMSCLDRGFMLAFDSITLQNVLSYIIITILTFMLISSSCSETNGILIRI